MIRRLQSYIEDTIFATANGATRRPQLDANFQSNVKDLFVVGDLAGAPVIKLAMEQGYDVVEHIASLGRPDVDEDVLDIVVVGAGAAGLNAALAAQEKGLKVLLLEKSKIANTIEDFPEGKWVYAEPDDRPAKGKLWLDGASKEDLVERWNQIVEDNDLDVRTGEPLTGIERDGNVFTLTTPENTYRTARIVLATGQRGNPRKLGVEGEDLEQVYHRLYSPRKYRDEQILVVGGGNSAVETALTLCEQNHVTLSYRGDSFSRLFKDNEQKLNAAVEDGRITLELKSEVTAFSDDKAELVRSGETFKVPYDHAFVLIGSEVPVDFLRSLGIRMENEWEGSLGRSALLTLTTLCGLWFAGGHTGLVSAGSVPTLALGGWMLTLLSLAGLVVTGKQGDRWSWLGASFLVWYTIYGAKLGSGQEFWPYRDWGYDALSFADRPWSFWYTVLYTGLMTVFGFQALKRWGLDRKDRMQVYRFVCLLGFQWLFFFVVPEFLFQWAVEYRWVGELADDPVFADQAWRSYGIVYAWPLFFYTFFYDPHHIWVIWGVLLTFVLIPIFVIFNGKRYCSWICGCGGLAETFGDRWRHLAPKGKSSIAWEKMNMGILILATVITGMMLIKDTWGLLNSEADWSIGVYRVFVDVWLIGILPVTLYPFLGGKIWCRYWCPLAKLMDLMSKFYAKVNFSRYHIVSNDKCIGCHECSRNCLVGIDVMNFAMKQETLDNSNSSCIGCGICVTVCPMDVLSFSADPDAELKQIEAA